MTGGGDERQDEGASLVIVLIVITVFALVTAAVLSQLGTNFRTTTALRDVAGVAYAGDGATQVAINKLVNDDFAGSGACRTTAATLPLSGFYPATNGQGAVGTQ